MILNLYERLSIRTKVTAASVVLIILPIALLGWIFYRESRAELLRRTTADLAALGGLLEREVASRAGQCRDALAFLARDPGVAGLAEGLAGDGGGEAARRLSARFAAVLETRLGRRFEKLFLLDPDGGKVLASSDPALLGMFFPQKEFFRRGREGAALCGINYSFALERSVVAVASPVTRGGRLAGVLAAWVDPGTILEVLGAVSPRRAYLVTPANRLLVDPEDRVNGFVRSGVFSDGAVRALGGARGSGRYLDHRGVEVVGAWAPVAPLGLALLVEEPLAAVMADAHRLGRRIFAVTLLLAVAVWGCTFAGARRLVRPLSLLADSLRAYGEGRTEDIADVPAYNSEARDLRDAFRRMIALRQEATAALRQSEERFRGIFDRSPQGIVVFDDAGAVADANREALALFGAAAPLDLAASVIPGVEWLPPDARDRLRSGAAARFEKAVAASGGTDGGPSPVRRLVLDCFAAPFTPPGGGGPGCLLHLRDVTEERVMLAELEKLRRLDSLGMLAGGIAHDFNNLLQGILGNISLARMHLDPGSDAARALVKAEESYGRAAELTGRLLTFAEGGTPLRRKMDLAPLLREAARGALDGSGVRCRVEIAAGLSPVEADAEQIAQVADGLLHNAREASPPGEEILLAAGEREIDPGDGIAAEPGRYVFFTVRDEGPGVDEADLHRIFDPFFTTKEKDSAKGTGLGLSIAYSVVRKHGGAITVDSRPGSGTAVTVFLPVAPEAAPATEPPRLFAGTARRILVMDDEPAVVFVAEEYLRQRGCEVVTAADGGEAVECCRTACREGRPFDAVILDLTVRGGIGGLEALDRIRKVDPAVPAILSTGFADDDAVREHRRHGFAGVLVKPYPVAALGDILARVL